MQFAICSIYLRAALILLSNVNTHMCVVSPSVEQNAGKIIQHTCIMIPDQLPLVSDRVTASQVRDAGDDTACFQSVRPAVVEGVRHIHVGAVLDYDERPIVPPAPVTLREQVWRSELHDDPNALFILNGISQGFSLVDTEDVPSSFLCKNYKSSAVENRPLVEKQILKEIDIGRYIVCNEPPPL